MDDLVLKEVKHKFGGNWIYIYQLKEEVCTSEIVGMYQGNRV